MQRPHLRLLRSDDAMSSADAWASAMRSEGLADRTVSERTGFLTRFEREVGKAAHRLDAAAIAEWFDQRLEPGTRATYHAHLRAYFAWLVRAELRDDNPMDKLRKPRTPRRRPRPIANAHLAVLLDTRMHRRTRTMILLACYEGLRAHEIAKVRGEDVDTAGEQLFVTGKGEVDEVLPLHDLVAAEAEHYPRRGWWFPSHVDPRRPVRANSVSAILSDVMRRASIPGTGHSLRHWYGTELRRSGADARTIQTLMRHASLATTAIYTDVDDNERRAAVVRLPTPRRPNDRIPPRPSRGD